MDRVSPYPDVYRPFRAEIVSSEIVDPTAVMSNLFQKAADEEQVLSTEAFVVTEEGDLIEQMLIIEETVIEEEISKDETESSEEEENDEQQTEEEQEKGEEEKQ